MSRPPVQQFAGHYITNMGWSVVPLPPREKKCVIDQWDHRTFTVDDFQPDSNIGIRSINGVVVVDDDFDTPAIEWADQCLPTPCAYGRGIHVRRKRLFLCPELKETVTLTDLDRTHLVQVRVGLQDMAPPSIHPDTGERLTWDGRLVPLEPVASGVLLTRVRYYWTARLMAKYWPARGRHELRLAYARVLLDTLDIPDDYARLILTWACRLGGSDANGVQDALAAIAGTRHRIEHDQPASGAPTLAQLLPDVGRSIVQKLREAYDKRHPIEEAIEELNETHAVVWMQSGTPIILTEDMLDGRPHQRFSKPQDMSLLYPQLMKIGKKEKALGSIWVTHPRRRFYRGIELAPHGRGNPGFYNLWRGFSVQPKQGDYPLFREHLKLVAGENEDHARYIWNWMAETIQHPERPIGIVLAFRGEQGTGKSTFAIWFGELFGTHFLHLDSEQHLLGRFNSHLHNIILLLADEAVWAGSKAGLGTLKRMITERTLNVEKKRVDIITVKNMLHMIVASNEKWVVPVGFDNRRFAIFGTSTRRKDDKRFFAAVHDELFNRGGLSALLYDLLNHAVNINLQAIPETDDLLEQKSLSADDEEAWWLEKLHQGYLVVRKRRDDTGVETDENEYEWPAAIVRDVLHDDYCAFLDKHRKGIRRSRSTETQLGIFLKKRTPLTDGGLSVFDDGRQRTWTVPTIEDCRADWARKCRWPAHHPWHQGLCPICGRDSCEEHDQRL